MHGRKGRSQPQTSVCGRGGGGDHSANQYPVILSPVLPPDRAPSRGQGSRENCMRMLAFNQSLKFSSGPAPDGSRIGPWEYMAPSYNSDREKLLTSTVCKQCNREERVDANKSCRKGN